MKLEALKKILKETVREVIQEELKDILLEAVKSPKVITSTPIIESITATPPTPSISTPTMSAEEQRNAYRNILGETETKFTSNSAQAFRPNPGMDVANGSLPDGTVGMDQILGLMNTNK